MTTPVLAAIQFQPPPTNPSPFGLFAATNWQDEPGPPRWLDSGVQFQPINYGGEDSFGVWGAHWCSGREPGSGSPAAGIKTGVRPDLPEPFTAFTAWAFDKTQCGDITAESQAETMQRAQQAFRLLEPVAVEKMFAERMIADAAGAVSLPSVRDAVAYLEGRLAVTGTLAQIHANPEAAALEFGLVLPQGTTLRTPLGHQWVFGGGYVDTLGDLLIATSPVFGWRDQPRVYPALDQATNELIVVVERSVIIGYEKLIAAVSTDVVGS